MGNLSSNFCGKFQIKYYRIKKGVLISYKLFSWFMKEGNETDFMTIEAQDEQPGQASESGNSSNF